MPRLLILAGPNGAGKSTFATSRFDELVGGNRFLNIDEIAAGRAGGGVSLSAFAAARVGLERRRVLIRDRESFAVETTLAGHSIVELMNRVRRDGYDVELIFLYLSDPALCHRRVAQRVALGGHDIPSATIERRYEGGLVNLPRAWDLAHTAQLFDADAEPRLIAEQSGALRIHDRGIWESLMPSR